MLRTIFTAIFLFVLWYLLSGLTKPLVLGLGVASAVVATIFVRRMDDAADSDRLELRMGPFASIGYLFWLLKEIAKANWSVTKVIMSPDMPMRQHFFSTPFSQKSELGQAVFGNSITLTPGTITVEVEADHFLVHALEYSDTTMDELAEMDGQVLKVEEGI